MGNFWHTSLKWGSIPLFVPSCFLVAGMADMWQEQPSWTRIGRPHAEDGGTSTEGEPGSLISWTAVPALHWLPLHFYETEKINVNSLFSLVAKPHQNKYFHLILARETHIRAGDCFITPSQVMSQEPLSKTGLLPWAWGPSEPRRSDAPTFPLLLGWFSFPSKGHDVVLKPSFLAWVQKTVQLCQPPCLHSGPQTHFPSCKLRLCFIRTSLEQKHFLAPLEYRPCKWGIFNRN